MKRIITIQDISCVGKCSLTVALPIISAAGVEAGILPTAVLSTHTQFSSFTFCDLTPEIEKISTAFEQQSLYFDAIYTGYLGSFEQLALVSDLFDRNRAENCAIVVDPVMADNGKLYKGFTPEFAKEMAKLCGKADLIIPNLTEASFMLGVPYNPNSDEQYIRDMLVKLAVINIRHHKKKICIGNLIKGRLKRLNKMVRKLANKSNGIRQKNTLSGRKLKLSRSGIQGSKKLILREDTCIGKIIQKRRFSCVRISDDSRLENSASIALRTHNRTVMLQFLKPALKSRDTLLQMASIGLKLRFPGTARAYSSALSRKLGSVTYESWR